MFRPLFLILYRFLFVSGSYPSSKSKKKKERGSCLDLNFLTYVRSPTSITPGWFRVFSVWFSQRK